MSVLGIDFGTTNLRMAILDEGEPELCPFASGETARTTMPTVIAFTRDSRGTVHADAGDEADQMVDGHNTVVLRNIKRWALGSDPFVEQQLGAYNADFPVWWDAKTRIVHVWENRYPIAAIIQTILRAGFEKAGLRGFNGEWRAGCPVNADLTYRRDLTQAIGDIVTKQGGPQGKVQWITEEPVAPAGTVAARSEVDGQSLVSNLRLRWRLVRLCSGRDRRR